MGLLIVVLLKFGFISRNDLLAIVIVGLFVSYLSKKIKIPIIHSLLQKFERKKELETFPGKGIIFYLTGSYAALLFFPKEVAMASIMVLALGDSVSHLFGLHFGKMRHPLSEKKFFEGTIAGFFAGFLGALAFLPWNEAFFASMIAMIAEAIEIKIGSQQVDDNLLVPFVAGFVVWLMRIKY